MKLSYVREITHDLRHLMRQALAEGDRAHALWCLAQLRAWRRLRFQSYGEHS